MSKQPLTVIGTGIVHKRFRLPMGRKKFKYALKGGRWDILGYDQDHYVIPWDGKALTINRDCLVKVVVGTETSTGALHKSAGFPGTDQVTTEQVKTFQGTEEYLKKAPEQGSRHNEGKLKWSLIDYPSMEGMVRVLEKGAIKYAPYNWQKGLKFTEMLESMQRHTAALMAGEDIDSETGEFHEDLIHCNAMFLSWMRKHRPDMDDRNRYPDYPKKLLSEL